MFLIGEFTKAAGRRPVPIGAFALEILENFYRCLTSFPDRDLYENSELILCFILVF